MVLLNRPLPRRFPQRRIRVVPSSVGRRITASLHSNRKTHMIRSHPPDHSSAVEFGPFRLIPATALLLRDDRPIELGSRARGILLALVEKAGEVVSHADILDRVWPHTIVSGATLRVHMAALRRVLSRSSSDPDYIQNIHGHGYRFVIPVRRVNSCQPLPGTRVDRGHCDSRQSVTELMSMLVQCLEDSERLLNTARACLLEIREQAGAELTASGNHPVNEKRPCAPVARVQQISELYE